MWWWSDTDGLNVVSSFPRFLLLSLLLSLPPLLLLSSTTHTHTHTYSLPALHGGGGLGQANFTEAPPFTFCPTFGEGDELGNVYGPEAILKTRAHVGSSERVRRVLRRAMAGLPISESVERRGCHYCTHPAFALLPTPSSTRLWAHRFARARQAGVEAGGGARASQVWSTEDSGRVGVSSYVRCKATNKRAPLSLPTQHTHSLTQPSVSSVDPSRHVTASTLPPPTRSATPSDQTATLTGSLHGSTTCFRILRMS